MPRPIKKKTAKPARTENDLSTVMSRITEAAEARKRQIIAASAALALAVLLALGAYIYRSGAEGRALRLEYEGYKQYFGLYGSARAPERERIEAALASINDAYRLRETPYLLFLSAGASYSLGRYDEAVETLRRLNSEFPDDERFVPLSYYKMAMAELGAGRPEEALKALDVIDSYRTDSLKDLALLDSARILEGLGRNEEAQEKYAALADRFPASGFAAMAGPKLGADEKDEGEKEAGP